MDILNATLIADLTAAVYSVIGKNKLEYTKENATKVINALANVCSSLCAISKLDFDVFLQEAKDSHDEFMKSDVLGALREKYPVKDSSDVSTNVAEYAGKQSTICSVIENKTALTPEGTSFSTDVFNLVLDKCVEIMEEKQLLIADMPLLIGCLGSMGAYFSNIYNVSRDVLTTTISNYYNAMDSYDPDKDLGENVEKLKSKLNLKDVNTVANVSSNKKKFDLN